MSKSDNADIARDLAGIDLAVCLKLRNGERRERNCAAIYAWEFPSLGKVEKTLGSEE